MKTPKTKTSAPRKRVRSNVSARHTRQRKLVWVEQIQRNDDEYGTYYTVEHCPKYYLINT